MQPTNQPSKRPLIQRLPAVLFGITCVISAAVAAIVFFILGAIFARLIPIAKELEPPLLLAFALAGALLTIYLTMRARNRKHLQLAPQQPEASFPSEKAIASPTQSADRKQHGPDQQLFAGPDSKKGLAQLLKRPWIYIGLVLTAILVKFLFSPDSSLSNLRVVSYPAQVRFPLTLSPRLTITNVGDHPVRILGIEVNEREDCSTSDDILSQKDSTFPIELKVGDTGTWFTKCGIVRTTIKTSDGTATYTF
jgi:hypothetical protein